MVPISISAALKHALPVLALGCISGTLRVEQHHDSLWQEIDAFLVQLAASYKIGELGTIPQIAAMRSAYKALGKDPSRYRGSAEALLRRVLSGKGLYRVNNVVAINNLVSLQSLLPAGSYDLGNVNPPIELRIGAAGESYKGIGKDELNIENLPVFADVNGPFGSPTSDSERAMIRLESSNVLMVIFSFSGPRDLERWTTAASHLLQRYADAQQIETAVIA